jgi:hypothetical protein
MIENVRSIAIDGHPLLKCGRKDRRAYTGAIRNQQGAHAPGLNAAMKRRRLRRRQQSPGSMKAPGLPSTPRAIAGFDY